MKTRSRAAVTAGAARFAGARVVGLAVCGVLAGPVSGCRSLRGDEALAMLDVSAGAGVPTFTTARFSVAGRAEILPHEVRYDGRGALSFGYYLPGPNGTLRITAQALSASCLVGVGSAAVDVQLGRVSVPVALVIAPLAELDSTCLASIDGGDASHDGAADARADTAGRDAGADSAPPPPPPPPACLVATKPCPGATACCSGLACGNTSLGHVCCGNFGMTCSRPGGEDCCGQLECRGNRCCLPATYPCSDNSCCDGLVCGTTSLGHVCCGNSGAHCETDTGVDCCGALRCVGNVCRT